MMNTSMFIRFVLAWKLVGSDEKTGSSLSSDLPKTHRNDHPPSGISSLL